MGRSGAKSSKRKSSSSSDLKKKRRSMEQSKKRSKLGSRKFKKTDRRDDSDLVSDYDSSYSSSSHVSSVSRSGSDIKRRRSRSRLRKDRQKRSVRRRSLTSDSDESVERVRKRKKSRKSKDTSRKRRKVSKKKRRREPSVSSSSRSRSCSTCKSSEDNDSDTERKQERLNGRVTDGRDFGQISARTNSRCVSRSCSPYSLGGKDDEYPHSLETNSRRLRSIIVFTRRSDDELEDKFTDYSDQKEEIMYGHDGYLSSKSNDSNEEESMKEVTESMEPLNQKTISLIVNLQGDQTGINPSEAELDGSLKATAVEAGSNAEDLETILRQRALENLKKFRGKKPVLVKGNCDTGGKVLSAPLSEFNESNTHSPGRDTNDTEQRKKETLHVAPLDAVSTDSYPSSQHRIDATKVKVNNDSIDHSSSDKPRQDALPSKKSLLQKRGSGTSTSISVGSKGVPEKLQSLSHDTKDTMDILSSEVAEIPLAPMDNKQTTASKFNKERLGMDCNSSVKDMLTSQGSEKSDERSNSEIDQLNTTADDNAEKSKPTRSTSENQNVEGQSSSQQQDGSNDGSQFQQKTMSVMRGGEMVQVSYKVYIPKKAPALARRKLRR